MNNQKGFTLIELVVVIVILGILSAFAVPKFVNMQDDAKEAVADGVLGAAKSAVALNHAKKLVNDEESNYPAYDGDDCTDGLITTGTCLENALEELPDGWLADDDGGVGNTGIHSPFRANGNNANDVNNAEYAITIDSVETQSEKAVVSGTW